MSFFTRVEKEGELENFRAWGKGWTRFRRETKYALLGLPSDRNHTSNAGATLPPDGTSFLA